MSNCLVSNNKETVSAFWSVTNVLSTMSSILQSSSKEDMSCDKCLCLAIITNLY